MQRLTFDELFALLSAATLSSTDLARLQEWIAGIAHPAECLALIEQAAHGRPCPHCQCPHLHRCGCANGLQRFRCCQCGRSHNALTKTPLARLRKREHWLTFLQCLLDSRTVRDTARVTGVHRTTSFRWRHRFVPAAARDRPAALSSIVEADETYRLESQKGARKLSRRPRRRGGVASRRGINGEHDCLLIARDRTGQTLDFHTGRGLVSAAQFNLGCPTSQQLTGSTALGLLSTSTLLGRTFCNYDIDQYAEAQGWGKDANVLSHGELKLGQNVTAFTDLSFSRADRKYTGAPISIGTTSVTNFTTAGVTTPYQTILPIGHPDNPFTDARSSVAYRFVNLQGGSRSVDENARVVAGLRGSHLGWDWESAVLWNRSERDDTSFGRLYLPTLRTLVTENRSLAALSADPTLGHDVVTHNKSQIAQWDAKASTEFGQLQGGKIGLAVGAELRRESINLNPDPLVAAGDIYGLANTILDSGRNVRSAFVEVRTPVLKNLEFDFAGRVDKYPSIKTNFVPKVGAKWTISDMFAIRGTYAEGFRAPSLSQIVAGGAQYFLSGVWDPKRCGPDQNTPLPGGGTTLDCARGIAGTGGFNPNLKPEESKSYNLGFIISPTNNFDMTFDFYHIKRTNEIVLGSADEALKNEAATPQNVTRNTNTASLLVDGNGVPIPGTGELLMVATPWENQGRTEIGGVDIEARLRNKLGTWGSLSTTVRSTYVGTYTIQEHDGAPTHNLAGSIPGYSDWALSTGTAMPRWKGSLSSTWSRGDHNVNASLNYVGPVSLLRRYDGDTTYALPFCAFGTKKSTDAAPDRNTSNPLYETFYPDCSIKEWVTIGLGYTYTGFKHWTLAANIQNLFDNKAPYDPTSAAVTAGFNENLHNPYGRYFNFSARYTF